MAGPLPRSVHGLAKATMTGAFTEGCTSSPEMKIDGWKPGTGHSPAIGWAWWLLGGEELWAPQSRPGRAVVQGSEVKANPLPGLACATQGRIRGKNSPFY